MKTNLRTFFALMLIAVSPAIFAQNVAGNYDGTMNISLIIGEEPVEMPAAQATVTISTSGEATSLSLKNFFMFLGETPLFVGNVTLPSIGVGSGTPIAITGTDNIAITDGDADFSVQTTDGTLKVGDLINPQDPESDVYAWQGPALTEANGGSIPVSITDGSISGNTLNLDLNIDFTQAPPPLGGFAVRVQFVGGNIDVDAAAVSPVSVSAAQGILYINGLEAETPYAIYNVIGAAAKMGAAQDAINISGLAKGVYLIKIGNTVAKFAKN